MKFPSLFVFCALAVLTATAHGKQDIGSLADLNAFLEDETPRTESLVLTGKVLNVFITPKSAQIILSDESGVRAEIHRFTNATQPTPGDTIRATGHAYMSKSLESYSHMDEFEVIEHGSRPEPTPVKLSEIRSETHHLMTISTEGTVVDAVIDEMDSRYMILILKDDGATIPVTIPLNLFGDRSDLVDARIRVTGIYRHSVSGIRKVSWPNIQPISPDDIKVVVPPPKDPFSAPPLEKRLYLMTEDFMKMSKRTISGEVLATWAGNRAMVRTVDGRIVNLELANGAKLPKCGETIVAVGQPETDLFRVNLAAVRWKPDTGHAATVAVEEPGETSAANIFWNDNGRKSIDGKTHGTLLYVQGIVRMLPSPESTDLRFVVDMGGLQVPVDVTSNPSILDDIAIGSKVKATGRCVLLTDARRPDNIFPQVSGFVLVARSPADVVVLSRPPWWTPGRLAVLVAILLMTIAGVETWHLIQRHLARLKISERTRLAVELHDSLSQNLAGVTCQVAAGSNAIDDDPQTAKSRIKSAERMLQSCRTELRNCLFDLRSDMLEETNFKSAILKALNQLTDESSISIRFNARRSDFPDPAAHAILSVIRELTANAVRRGHAANVRIAGCTDNGNLLFSVTDDGSGFDPESCAGMTEGHFRLSGVRDRLKRLNGTLAISSTPGKGAKATVTLPIPKT